MHLNASSVIALFLPIFLFVPAKNQSEPTLAVAHKKKLKLLLYPNV